MRKVFMFAALVAASTAFVGCSSDEDLAQVPEIIEEVAPQGTPFTVKAFGTDDTRAVRYGVDGTDGGENFVNCFKLYAKQAGASDPWIDHVVFTRPSTQGKWTPARNNQGGTFSGSLSWPTQNVENATTFYAVTDNAIASAQNNPITGLQGSLENGKFVYSLTTGNESIYWYNNDNNKTENINRTIVTDTSLKDLMVATATKTESDSEGGQIGLTFTHALAGLTIKAKFLCNAEAKKATPSYAIVKNVAVYGLKTSGTYTYDGSTWNNQNTQALYFYSLPEPVTITSQKEDTAPASQTVETVVPAGEWLIIPQTFTSWDRSTDGNWIKNEGVAVAITLYESVAKKDYTLFYPLSFKSGTAFIAGRNHTITIDIGQLLDLTNDYDNNDGTAGLYYNTTTVIAT